MLVTMTSETVFYDHFLEVVRGDDPTEFLHQRTGVIINSDAVTIQEPAYGGTRQGVSTPFQSNFVF